MNNRRQISVFKIGGAILTGLLLTASFPDMGRSYIAWFALVPLMGAIREGSPLAAFRLGLLGGMVHYLSLIYWIIPCLRNYGMLPLYLSVAILLLFSAYLSLFIAGFAAILNWTCRSVKMLLFAAPVIWVACEYIRANLFTGFPWELFGYSQFRITPLIQFADILGVYGVSWLLVLGNCSILCLVLALRKSNWHKSPLTRNKVLTAWACFILVLASFWGYGVRRLETIEAQAAKAPLKRVAVIQGNIPQEKKWDTAFQLATVDRYLDMSRREAAADPELIVWPETALPFYFGHNAPLTNRVFRGIAATGADYIVSSPSFIRQGDTVAYRNRAFMVSSREGCITGIYDKAHLVPFGEYVPLKAWLPFLGKLVAQVGDFTPGEQGIALEWENHRIGMLICYELIFPYLSRESTRNGANLLVSITNDAWYGKTSAPYQHFSMGVFRAVENRRTLARSANTGISGFIEPTGKISATTPIFEEAALTGTVPLMQISTLYTRFGDWFSLACVILSFAMMIFRIFRQKN